MNKVNLLFNAFQPPEIEVTAEPLNNGICAISGQRIAEGVPINKLVTGATNQPHEIFRVSGTRHVSIQAARLFKCMRGGNTGGMIGNLLATSSGGIKPMVSRDSAIKSGRDCWMDIINTIELGTPTVALFSTDTKRRLWLLAELSMVGSAWRVYLHDGNISRNLTVNIWKLRDCLALLEQVYILGFSKYAMQESLFDFAVIRKNKLDYAEVLRLENAVAAWRNTDEFLLSVFVVQKPLEKEESECKTQPSLKPNPQLADLPLFA